MMKKEPMALGLSERVPCVIIMIIEIEKIPPQWSNLAFPFLTYFTKIEREREREKCRDIYNVLILISKAILFRLPSGFCNLAQSSQTKTLQLLGNPP